MNKPRYLEKFENAAGTVSYTFPLYAYEYESSQTLKLALSSVSGASYSYDHYGAAPVPKEDARESVRFLDKQNTTALLEADLDNMKARLWSAGRGKLYTIGSDGSRRWAWARLAAMPQISIRRGLSIYVPVALTFVRMSEWYATSLYSVAGLSVVHSGNAPVTNAIIKVTTPAGVTLTNTANGFQFVSARNGAGTLLINCATGQVTFNGSDDYANVTLPGSQTPFMQYEPGTNTMTITGGSLADTSFYPAYH